MKPKNMQMKLYDKYTKWAQSDKHIREMEAQRADLRDKLNSSQAKASIKKKCTKSKNC